MKTNEVEAERQYECNVGMESDIEIDYQNLYNDKYSYPVATDYSSKFV